MDYNTIFQDIINKNKEYPGKRIIWLHDINAFTETVLGHIAETIPERYGIPSVFCPDKNMVGGCIEHYGKDGYEGQEPWDYGNDIHFVASLPLPTVVRYCIDGKSSRMDEYESLLRENAYFGHPNETLASILGRPETLAFCNGLDDLYYRRAATYEEHLAQSEKECPGYGEDYERGRAIAMRRFKQETGKDCGSRKRDYLVFCIVVENAVDPDPNKRNFRFMAKFNDTPYPESNLNDWEIQIPAVPTDSPRDIADKILDRIDHGPELREETGMRM